MGTRVVLVRRGARHFDLSDSRSSSWTLAGIQSIRSNCQVQSGFVHFIRNILNLGGESVGDARCVVLGVVAFLFPYPCADSPPDLVAVEWLRG